MTDIRQQAQLRKEKSEIHFQQRPEAEEESGRASPILQADSEVSEAMYFLTPSSGTLSEQHH